MIYRRLGLPLLALFLASCADRTAEGRGRTVVIEHVTVLDGRGGAALEDGRVVVSGGRIIDVGASAPGLDGGAVADG